MLKWFIAAFVIYQAFLIAFLADRCHAQNDQISTEIGLGVFGTRGSSLSQVKFVKLGLQEDLWYSFKERFNVGGWTDSRGDGRSGSGFAGYQVGFEVTNDTFQASIFTGPTLISSPDIALGGILQFNETIFFGIVNKQNETIGIAYNHFSSAGLEAPNLGRDFMGLQIKFPFY